MTRRFGIWLWLLLIALAVLGVIRLRFDVEILNLLPGDAPAVQGLKIHQQNFANARELILTLHAPDAEAAETAARVVAGRLRAATNLVARATWQPPWLEHPGQAAELIGYLWLNQPPETFTRLIRSLSPDRLAVTLSAAREQLSTTLSPADIARLSYDPFGLTQLPVGVAGAAPAFGQGQELFSGAEGTFRLVFVQAFGGLGSYRDCLRWLKAVKDLVESARRENLIPTGVEIGYTGRPAFVAEISSGMERDITVSVGGTALIIAVLFWLAHRRWKPMLWLLTLLALILAATLALGGLIFGAISVVSMGFAAILLGLAVDYAVVHYQEALAHPDLSVPEIRRAIAPSIFWAAVTTIAAFLVLNLGGLPGLAQLGSLVGLGVGISACVMIFAFLPPLFPDRRRAGNKMPGVHPAALSAGSRSPGVRASQGGRAGLARFFVFGATAFLVVASIATLVFGFPKMDATANALRPRNSQAYAALEEIKRQFSPLREPLWMLVGGRTESEVALGLDAVELVLGNAVSNRTLSGFTLAAPLWPRPEWQQANRAAAARLAGRRAELNSAAQSGGFTSNSMALAGGVLDTWQRAASSTNVFWPTNDMSRWIFEKLAARDDTRFYALSLLYPDASAPVCALMGLEEQLQAATADPALGRRVWLSGWELLGQGILASVRGNLWKLVLPMLGLVLISLALAFRRGGEVLLSLAILLLSGLVLLAVMRLAGWSWNLLNLMALPLILGTGVDYSIFMQLALRRYGGDLRLAHRSVGRALLLCCGTAVAGFGAIAFSSNAGMASLGRLCAVGIACNGIISVFLLPVWWRALSGHQPQKNAGPNPSSSIDFPPLTSGPLSPSSLYRAELWQAGLWVARRLPRSVCLRLAVLGAAVYWRVARRRREIVIANILPVLAGDRAEARRTARLLVSEFAVKLVDLWRYEAGLPVDQLLSGASGWEHFLSAQARGRGVLLLTLHLGNWEFGAPWLKRQGVSLLVITLPEPGRDFTRLRQASRAAHNIETQVIGEDPFAFVEIIRRLEAGACVALLMDRPPPATAVSVELFGRPFAASVAAAELARASGCALLPVYLPRMGGAYAAHTLPEIFYDRAALRDRAVRQALTQQILRAFEPVIRAHLDQWYHFVPVWLEPAKPRDPCTHHP